MTTADPIRSYPWLSPHPSRIPAEYAALRSGSPVTEVVLASGQHAWLVMGHDLFRQLLTDSRVSADHAHPGFPALFPVVRRRIPDGAPHLRTYSGMDRGEHGRHRRRVDTEFAPDSVARFAAATERIVASALDTLLTATAPVDLVATVAEPVAAEVITGFLGIPEQFRGPLGGLAETLSVPAGLRGPVADARIEFRRLVAAIVEDAATRAPDSVIGRLVGRYQRADEFDPAQLVELVGALLIAGHVTTWRATGLAVLMLLEDRGRYESLVADPTAIPAVVEELLRMTSVADTVTMRVALEDIPLPGVTIRKGDGVIASGAAANFDPTVFADPNRFDPHRPPPAHVAFGHGIHKCIGQHLARLELTTVLRGLVDRAPMLRLVRAVGPDPSDPVPPLRSLHQLWVTNEDVSRDRAPRGEA